MRRFSFFFCFLLLGTLPVCRAQEVGLPHTREWGPWQSFGGYPGLEYRVTCEDKVFTTVPVDKASTHVGEKTPWICEMKNSYNTKIMLFARICDIKNHGKKSPSSWQAIQIQPTQVKQVAQVYYLDTPCLSYTDVWVSIAKVEFQGSK